MAIGAAAMFSMRDGGYCSYYCYCYCYCYCDCYCYCYHHANLFELRPDGALNERCLGTHLDPTRRLSFGTK